LTVSKRNIILILGVVAVLAALAAIYTVNIMRAPHDYGDISIQEARELIEEKNKLVLLDVRTIPEYNEGHLENAINIPVQELADRLDELNKNDEILVYCRTGNRSSTAVDILNNAGLTKIYHMHEGISIWIQQGYPVVQ
jgi:rhodanese-related sulfurtransferase